MATFYDLIVISPSQERWVFKNLTQEVFERTAAHGVFGGQLSDWVIENEFPLRPTVGMILSIVFNHQRPKPGQQCELSKGGWQVILKAL